jgi:hypothetical protein
MKHETDPRIHQVTTLSRSRISVLAAAAASLALLPTALGGSAATAAPSPWEVVHEVYDTQNPLTFENFCHVQGLTVVAGGSIDFRQRTTTQGADGLPYYTSHTTAFVDSYTNKATGAVATSTGKYTFHTIRVTDNGDGTLTVMSQYTINTQITDNAGHIVARDTGIYRYVSVVDHGGTPSDPSDDIELESSDLRSNGLETDACAVIVTAIT